MRFELPITSIVSSGHSASTCHSSPSLSTMQKMGAVTRSRSLWAPTGALHAAIRIAYLSKVISKKRFSVWKDNDRASSRAGWKQSAEEPPVGIVVARYNDGTNGKPQRSGLTRAPGPRVQCGASRASVPTVPAEMIFQRRSEKKNPSIEGSLARPSRLRRLSDVGRDAETFKPLAGHALCWPPGQLKEWG